MSKTRGELSFQMLVKQLNTVHLDPQVITCSYLKSLVLHQHCTLSYVSVDDFCEKYKGN